MRQAPELSGIYGRFPHELPVNASLARLADQQHGVVSLSQLQLLGLSASAVQKRTANGHLHRVHRGVYAVGYRRLTERGRWMAAVLTFGPGAVLSHRDAAALLGLRQDRRPRIDVTVPRVGVRRRPGIDAHVSATVRPADVTVQEGIPCTSVARTLLDL